MEQFRWFTGGWPVNAELPVPASFEVASRTVREEDVAAQMPCGPDLERHLAGIREFEAAGFTVIPRWPGNGARSATRRRME
jgi:hypothetical protein